MWQGIFGHDAVVEQFRRTLASGRLASTYLFVGPAGIGKRRFALELAHSLLCTQAEEAVLASCGQCESCRLFAAGNHPDLEAVGLPADKSSLPIALFVGDDQHRNREGLCHKIALKPYFGRRRIAIIDDADHFSIPSANCLLKTLEEPPASALVILIGTSPARQLPTIRSRSQIVRFQPLERDTVRRILEENGLISDGKQAGQAAALGEGSVQQALRMADPQLGQFRAQLQAELRRPMFDALRQGRAIQAFVDEAGKEASRRRDRLRLVIGFAVEFYRGQLCEARMRDADAIISALDTCLAALEHIDRNVNQATLIAWWVSELARVPAASR